MAQINVNNIERLVKQRNTIHEEVRATYTIFESNGKSMFRSIHMAEKIVNLPRRLANQFS